MLMMLFFLEPVRYDDDAGKVTWSKMDPDALAKVVRKMDELGAKPEDIDQIKRRSL